MMCAKCITIVMTNKDLARGGGTYETPYTLHLHSRRNILLCVMTLPMATVRKLQNICGTSTDQHSITRLLQSPKISLLMLFKFQTRWI